MFMQRVIAVHLVKYVEWSKISIILLPQQIKEASLIGALFRYTYHEMVADVYLKARFAQSRASKTISYSVWIMITGIYAHYTYSKDY